MISQPRPSPFLRRYHLPRKSKRARNGEGLGPRLPHAHAHAIQTRVSFAKRSETSVKIIKNEVRCREDTVPKTVDTRKHCKVGLRACNNLPQPPSLHLCFSGLRKIVACSQPYLAVLSCIYSFWHGVIPTSYFIFNDFYTCIYTCSNVHVLLHL